MTGPHVLRWGLTKRTAEMPLMRIGSLTNRAVEDPRPDLLRKPRERGGSPATVGSAIRDGLQRRRVARCGTTLTDTKGVSGFRWRNRVIAG
ncbi:hypothetical protein B296_00017608 [Ensete ventricosum]|uniref:Uncharacterized protein n=1 Tax=Ensete ventricosum TaxID=4639 RepID=A0A427AVR1_ENSVE|nr:hypothetical protein B296_00017608 [Ensete ventricosum]